MADDAPRCKQYYHPILHLASGQRLYYILLRASRNIDEVEKDICRITEREKLDESACIYLLFGDTDFLIRCWGSDLHVRQFASMLRDIPGIATCRTHLIDDVSTWYQKTMKIESASQGSLHPSPVIAFTDLAVAETTDSVRESMMTQAKTQQGPFAKFFVFGSVPEREFDAPYFEADRDTTASDAPRRGKAIHFFERLVKVVTTTRTPGLESLTRRSFYSFRDPGRHGVGIIVKAEVDTTSKWPAAVLELARLLKGLGVRRTTTYVCAKTHREEHELDLGRRPLPLSTRRFSLSENVLMSHGCRPSDLRFRVRSRHRAERLVELLCHNAFDLLGAGTHWDEVHRKLRFVYRTVAFRQNAELRSFLMFEYATFEQLLRETCEARYTQWAENNAKTARAKMVKGLDEVISQVRRKMDRASGVCQPPTIDDYREQVHDEMMTLGCTEEHFRIVLTVLNQAIGIVNSSSPGNGAPEEPNAPTAVDTVATDGFETSASRQVRSPESVRDPFDPIRAACVAIVGKPVVQRPMLEQLSNFVSHVSKEMLAKHNGKEPTAKDQNHHAAEADSGGKPSEPAVLITFSKEICSSAEHRNKFMHGSMADDLFASEDDRNLEHNFEAILRDYIRLLLLWHPALDILRSELGESHVAHA